MSRTRLDRAVLKLAPKAADFLKAYSSNTQDKPRTAFVDLKGKIVATADQIVLSPDEALVAVERPFVSALREHLKTYLFLTGVCLEETPYSVAFDEDPSACAEHSIPWLGGKLLFSREPSGETPGEAFTRFRLERAWPLQGVDSRDELLLSVGDAEYVSYDKGCYLGQEIIARVHYKSKPPRVLAVVDAALRPDLASGMTSRTVVGGKTLGFAFIS